MNIRIKIANIYRGYRFTMKEVQLFDFFTTNIKNPSPKRSKKILVQCVEDPFYYLLFGQIISDLQNKKSIEVEQYIVRNFSVGSYESVGKYLKSKLHNNRFKDQKWTKLYSSYCHRVAYGNEEYIGASNELKLFIEAKKIHRSITTKDELVELESQGVKIGDLIYDTYLRFKPAPTVDLDDFYLAIVIWKALRNIYITKKYFDREKPDILLQSYSTYIQHGITSRIALRYDIDVYTFGSYQTAYKKLSPDDYYHVIDSSNYKNDFELLIDKDKRLQKARKGLEERLSGVVGRTTNYMKESAYLEREKNIPNVEGCSVVFLHDFYDSPHIYKSMIFADFLEWVEFTIEQLEENNIQYYIKPHPNQLADSAKVVESLQNKYPYLKILSKKITNKQLVDAGIKVGITVYGTVAHELAYMGIPVIACGDNPHSSYNFCYEAKDKEMYRELIRDIPNLKYKNKAVVQEEVESFYYMHNLLSSQAEQEFSDILNQLRKVLTGDYTVEKIGIYLKNLRSNTAYIEFVNSL